MSDDGEFELGKDFKDRTDSSFGGFVLPCSERYD
jgi:hypothetical protein